MIVPIIPIKAKFNDNELATKLLIRVVGDDLVNVCNVYWAILSDYEDSQVFGYYTFSGEKYQQWDGSADYVLNLILEETGIKVHTNQE